MRTCPYCGYSPGSHKWHCDICRQDFWAVGFPVRCMMCGEWLSYVYCPNCKRKLVYEDVGPDSEKQR
ncbi:MAG: hypothetical protein KIH08_15370 [Candidatus Freyarchaeota archaeon]|nr:hypothetical protein [Candidatus Jordarchaeia archaeon]MBS7270512.1 hypothetical protein [Candidatus Jordarchaeia archaeon]MBS7281294.1 hypothetical protein [Candidatus Jordarchaeia archaeon]